MAEPWRVKYDGVCSRCGVALSRGMPAVYERSTRTIRCIECPTSTASAPPASAGAPPEERAPSTTDGPVDSGVAGASARAEHDRREAKRDAAITARWGTGVASKVVRVFSEEPHSTRAWAIGAAGEEKLAAELDKVPGLLMLHDRRVPGTRGNIDHIIVAPAGVFVVDAKNHKGRIEIRDRGGFFRSDYRLMVGGRDCSDLADKMGWQVEAVRVALASDTPVPPIVPVLCFVNVEWPLFGAPDEFRGVRVESHRSLARLLNASEPADSDELATLHLRLSRALPAK